MKTGDLVILRLDGGMTCEDAYDVGRVTHVGEKTVKLETATDIDPDSYVWEGRRYSRDDVRLYDPALYRMLKASVCSQKKAHEVFKVIRSEARHKFNSV